MTVKSHSGQCATILARLEQTGMSSDSRTVIHVMMVAALLWSAACLHFGYLSHECRNAELHSGARGATVRNRKVRRIMEDS